MKTNRGRICGLCVVISALYGVFKSALNCSRHSFDSHHDSAVNVVTHTGFLFFFFSTHVYAFLCVPHGIGFYPVAMYAWYMHNFCFAGPIKFKHYNTSKPGICLHQIGGDC